MGVRDAAPKTLSRGASTQGMILGTSEGGRPAYGAPPGAGTSSRGLFGSTGPVPSRDIRRFPQNSQRRTRSDVSEPHFGQIMGRPSLLSEAACRHVFPARRSLRVHPFQQREESGVERAVCV